MELKDKTALITGGASGLGAGTAKRFHRAGANVVIADLNRQKGEALCDELSTNAAFVETDVTETAKIQSAIDLSMEKFGSVHILVNCAGIDIGARTVGRKGPMDLEFFRKVINTNLIGSFDAIRLAAFGMQKNQPNDDGERGVIINTASIAAYEGQIGQVSYAASKAGLVGLTLPVARDLTVLGIRICTIAPGIFDTPMMDNLPEAVRESLGGQVPFPKRLGTPDEYAMLAQQIVENPMFNGETIRLDGALRMSAK